METLVVTPSFWKDKRVFLTGHTGFKGSWLSLWLQSLGAQLTGFSLEAPTTPSLFEEASVAQGMRSVISDIRDFPALDRSVRESQPEIIIHMAAQSLVRYGYAHPVETYATNMMGTVHLFETARSIEPLKALVHVSTDKCYENREWVWGYRENDPMGGYDPYSNSKGCAELLVNAYRLSFFQHSHVALASARAGNVIGGGDWAADRLIPDILYALEHGQPLCVRNPLATRPWQHVLEPLSGYLLLAEKLYEEGNVWAEGWNFGPDSDNEVSVEDLIKRVEVLLGKKILRAQEVEHHLHEAHALKLDISKAQRLLGWTPLWDLEEALERVVSWYITWKKGGDVRSACLEQIRSYRDG